MGRSEKSVVRVVGVLAITLVLLGAAAPADARHPIHSTLADITYDATSRTATVRVRAFADDFGPAIAKWGRAHPRKTVMSTDSLSFDYLSHTISVERPPNQPAILEWCGVEKTGAVLWLCLRTKLDHGLEGVRVSDRVLDDLFDDEINIVQMESSGRKASAVFTKSDQPKVLIEQTHALGGAGTIVRE
jgi:hypothetical protein